MNEYSGYELSRREKTVFTAVLAAFLGIAGLIFYNSILTAAALPFIWRKAEKTWCVYKSRQRRNNLLLQFRDFLYSLSGSFAAGRHMAEAMSEAEENLSDIYGRECMLSEEIRCMLRAVDETGMTELEVLSDFARRSCLEDVEDFVQVYGACRSSGGNLAGAVNKAAQVIGEKITVEQEIHAIVSQKKLEGRIIMAMPAVIVLFLQLMSPDYLEIMYQTLAGRLLMSTALTAELGAGLMIERITRIEV